MGGTSSEKDRLLIRIKVDPLFNPSRQKDHRDTPFAIADRAEIARSALARYERGDQFPSVPELRRLCEALGVTPEHLIFGDDSPGFTRSQFPAAAAAAAGKSKKARIARHVLTGILLNTLPNSERDAFQEPIWASFSRHLQDQPDALKALSDIYAAVVDSLWDEIDSLVGEKLETDPRLRSIVEPLSDREDKDL